MAITDDFTDNTTTKGQLSVSKPSTGSIDFVGDIDWFKVTLTAGQHIQLDLQGSSANAGTLYNPYLAGIYDSGGNYIANSTDYNSGNGYLNSRLYFTASTAGTYYVAAGGENSNLGTYTLTTTAITDDFTDNTTTKGLLNFTKPTTGSIDFPGDIDWFKVTLTAGQHIQLDLQGSSANAGTLYNPYLAGIYDSGGNYIANSTDYNSGNGYLNSRLYFTASTAGTYYVAAGGENSNLGTYTLTTTAITDDFTDNTTTKGLLNFTKPTTGSIDFPGDIDWFKVTLTAGQHIQLDLQGSSANAGTLYNPYLAGIYDSGGNYIPNTTDYNSGNGYLNSRLYFTASTAGT